MKDWKGIAAASNLAIPAADLERITGSLDALEAAFRPLAAAIPHLCEPALVYQPEPEAEE
jgi:hypothetical protein